MELEVDPKTLYETLCLAQAKISDDPFTTYAMREKHVQRLQGLIDQIDKHRPVTDSLDYIQGVYDRHRAPGTPNWEGIKPRVEKYLTYLFSSMERVS